MSPKEKDAHAEELWNFVAMSSELEIEKHAEGWCLEAMGMHCVFELVDKHRTIQEMRTCFRSVGVESFKRIGMTHFLIFNYGYDWIEVVNAPHCGNHEGIDKAKQTLEEVTRAFAEARSTKAAAEAAKNADEAAAVERQKEASPKRRRRRLRRRRNKRRCRRRRRRARSSRRTSLDSSTKWTLCPLKLIVLLILV